MKKVIAGFFLVVLAGMTWITVTASLERSVFEAGSELWADPWFKATLIDAYFAFLTAWLVIVAREDSWVKRLAWLVAILLLGNFAIAAYFLWALKGLPPQADWR
ncbi:MAG: DUF1475 domain-containing protein, partial [Acidobacteriota bacterium]